MNPTLEFAQAIDGRTTGQGTGIIDTVHLFEVARASATLEKSRGVPAIANCSATGATGLPLC